MIKVALLIKLQAEFGKKRILLLFLEADLYSLIRKPQYQLGQSIFGIFDTFITDEKWRNAHLIGPVTTSLMANANELLTKPSTIERVGILAIKISKKNICNV